MDEQISSLCLNSTSKTCLQGLSLVHNMTQGLALQCVHARMFAMRRVASRRCSSQYILETATAAELQLAVHYSIVMAVRVERPDLAVASSDDSSSEEEDLMVLFRAKRGFHPCPDRACVASRFYPISVSRVQESFKAFSLHHRDFSESSRSQAEKQTQCPYSMRRLKLIVKSGF